MTLESVFQQWASSIEVDPSSPTTRTLSTDIDGARIASARSYIKCVLTGTSNLNATYPFIVEFVPPDGHKGSTSTGSVSGYQVDMSVEERATSANVDEEAVTVKYVPANSTMIKYFMSADWEVGSATAFESQRALGNTIW